MRHVRSLTRKRGLANSGAGRRCVRLPADTSGTSAAPRLRRVEALLYLARQPLNLRQIATAAALSGPADARDAVAAIRRSMALRGSALEITDVAGGLQMLTKPQSARWLPPPAGPAAESPLTPASLETLSIVAARQPVVRAEVEAIRGVGCGELLRQLLDADLLRIVGRSGELGKPLMYGTTTRFLRVFGLRDLDDLPLPNQDAEPSQPTRQNASPPADADTAA